MGSQFVIPPPDRRDIYMQKPSAKWVIIFNIVLDLPMAIIMAVSAALLSHQPLVLVPNLLSNIVIAFCLAFLINVILPIPLISAKFAGLFGIKPHTLGESLVGGIPVCLIFNVGIGLPLTIFKLAMAHQLKMLWPAFFGTFIPLYIILYIVAFIMTPIAAKAANAACQ